MNIFLNVMVFAFCLLQTMALWILKIVSPIPPYFSLIIEIFTCIRIVSECSVRNKILVGKLFISLVLAKKVVKLKYAES